MKISNEDIVSWCDDDPETRYIRLVPVIRTFSKSDETGEISWSPLILDLLNKLANLTKVLDQLAITIRPDSWSGSLADILDERSVLFESLFHHDNEEVRAWARTQHTIIHEDITREREWESREDRQRNQTFE